MAKTFKQFVSEAKKEQDVWHQVTATHDPHEDEKHMYEPGEKSTSYVHIPTLKSKESVKKAAINHLEKSGHKNIKITNIVKH